MNNKISGIYKIQNIKNNHIYVGSAVDIENRKSKHFSDLKKGKHHSIYLQRAWNKYGEISFCFSVIEECLISELVHREQYYIDTLAPQYNICQVAGSLLGTKRSDEIKQKISVSLKGKKGWWTGKTFSDEHKARIGERSKGRPAWNKGKKNIYSEDTLKKMKEIKINKVESLEHRQKISNTMKKFWKNKKEILYSDGSHE